MRQLLLKESLGDRSTIELTGDDFHYLAHVRRLRAGDRVSLRDGDGVSYDATVETLSGGAVISLSLRRSNAPVGPEQSRLHLLQAVAKGPVMDRVVRQATELGVSSIVPFISRNSPGGDHPTSGRTARWKRIVRAACQQSGAEPPAVEQPRPFAELLQRWVEGGVGVVYL